MDSNIIQAPYEGPWPSPFIPEQLYIPPGQRQRFWTLPFQLASPHVRWSDSRLRWDHHVLSSLDDLPWGHLCELLLRSRLASCRQFIVSECKASRVSISLALATVPPADTLIQRHVKIPSLSTMQFQKCKANSLMFCVTYLCRSHSSILQRNLILKETL